MSADTMPSPDEREEILRRDDLRFVMGDKRGRRFVYSLLADCGMFRSQYTPDERLAAWIEGERNVALRLTTRITRDYPEAYIQLLNEGLNEHRRKSA